MKRRWASLRWVCTCATLCTAAAWVISIPGCALGTHRIGIGIGLYRGTVVFATEGKGTPVFGATPLGTSRSWDAPVRSYVLPDERLLWAPSHREYTLMGVNEWFLPLWIPALAFAGASLLLWRLHARVPRPFACPACSYPLTGLAPGSPCPECGAGSGERGEAKA